MPASVDDFTFNSNMAATGVFHVDDSLAVKALFFEKTGDAPCVEGYLMNASTPNIPAQRYLATTQDVFTLSDYVSADIDYSTTRWDDLHGDFYVVAAGQDCTRALDILK